MTPETLGQRVRRLREGASLTQDQLAEDVGISRPAINKIETGFTPNPHRSTIQKIAQVFQVTENYLRTGHDLVPLASIVEGAKRESAKAEVATKMKAESDITEDERAEYWKGKYEQLLSEMEKAEAREKWYQDLLLKKPEGNRLPAATEEVAATLTDSTPEGRVTIRRWGNNAECVQREMWPAAASVSVTPSYAVNQ